MEAALTGLRAPLPHRLTDLHHDLRWGFPCFEIETNDNDNDGEGLKLFDACIECIQVHANANAGRPGPGSLAGNEGAASTFISGAIGRA